jgi:PAS domain-containing protein
MLAQAGFAARYPQRKWDAEEMAPVRAAVTHLLNQHQPFPAIAIDRHWVIMQMNPAAMQLFALMGAGIGSSMIDTLLDPNVQANIENWPQVAHHALHRLRTESASRGGDPALTDAIEALAQVPAPQEPSLMPVVPTVFREGDLRLSLFTTIAQFGTPEDLALDDLKIELFFPSDDATDALLQAMG